MGGSAWSGPRFSDSGASHVLAQFRPAQIRIILCVLCTVKQETRVTKIPVLRVYLWLKRLVGIIGPRDGMQHGDVMLLMPPDVKVEKVNYPSNGYAITRALVFIVVASKVFYLLLRCAPPWILAACLCVLIHS